MSPYSQRTWISQKHTRMDKRTTFVQNAKCPVHLYSTFVENSKCVRHLYICTHPHTPMYKTTYPYVQNDIPPMYKTTYPLCTKRQHKNKDKKEIKKK